MSMRFFLKYSGKACALLLLALPTYCFSQNIKFISLEVAPWSYLDEENRQYVGIFPDVIREIENRTGHFIEITMASFSFDRINRELLFGRQDCTIVIEDPIRESYVVVGESLFEYEMGVIAKKMLPLEEYSDLYNMVISTNRKLIITEDFYTDKKLKKEFDLNYELGLKKIRHGRVDAVAGAIPTIQYLAKKNNIIDILGKPLILKLEPISLQCSKKSKNLIFMEDFNEAIKSMKFDGTLKKIIANHS